MWVGSEVGRWGMLVGGGEVGNWGGGGWVNDDSAFCYLQV